MAFLFPFKLECVVSVFFVERVSSADSAVSFYFYFAYFGEVFFFNWSYFEM